MDEREKLEILMSSFPELRDASVPRRLHLTIVFKSGFVRADSQPIVDDNSALGEELAEMIENILEVVDDEPVTITALITKEL